MVTPKTTIIVVAIMTLSCITALSLAMECAHQGYIAATEGDDNHAHLADMLRWYGNALRHRLAYWLAYSLWLARLMAWYPRRVLPRD